MTINEINATKNTVSNLMDSFREIEANTTRQRELSVNDISEIVNNILRNEEFERYCLENSMTADAEIEDLTKELISVERSVRIIPKTARASIINTLHDYMLVLPYPASIKKMLMKCVGEIIDR